MVTFEVKGEEMRNDVINMSRAWDKETVVRAFDQWSFDLRTFFVYPETLHALLVKNIQRTIANTQQNITTLRKSRKNKYFFRKAFVFFGLHSVLITIYPFNKNHCYLISFTSLKIIVKPQQ